MTTQHIAQAIQKARGLWEELRQTWDELGLPGSPALPQQMLTLLLLSQFEGGALPVAERLNAAQELLRQLRAKRAGGLLLLTDPVSLIALTLMKDGALDGAVEVETIARAFEPLPSPPQVLPCPTVVYQKKKRQRPKNKSQKLEGCPHVDGSGFCVSCSPNEFVDCALCNTGVLKKKAYQCKNSSCGQIVCPNCYKDDYANGFCDDCSTVSCVVCDGDIERSKAHSCRKRGCKHENFCCANCRLDLLTSRGWCAYCTREELLVCLGCSNEVRQTRLRSCRKCKNGFCRNCARVELKHQRCSNCRLL